MVGHAETEIIGSDASTYTRVVCMVCEEKGIEYVLTERPLGALELLAIIRSQNAGAAPWRCRLSNPEPSPPGSIAAFRPRMSSHPIPTTPRSRAMGLLGQLRDGPHPDPTYVFAYIVR